MGHYTHRTPAISYLDILSGETRKASALGARGDETIVNEHHFYVRNGKSVDYRKHGKGCVALVNTYDGASLEFKLSQPQIARMKLVAERRANAANEAAAERARYEEYKAFVATIADADGQIATSEAMEAFVRHETLRPNVGKLNCRVWVAMKDGEIVGCISMAGKPLEGDFGLYRAASRRVLGEIGDVVSGSAFDGQFYANNS